MEEKKYVYIAYYDDNEAIQSMDIFGSKESLKNYIDNEEEAMPYEEAIKIIEEKWEVEIASCSMVEKREVI